MVEEAEKYAQQDQELKEKIEARNSLENYAHLLKGQLNDKSETGLGSKLEDDDRKLWMMPLRRLWNLLKITLIPQLQKNLKNKTKID